MNWNRIGRTVFCLLVVCCLIINMSPLKAEATSVVLPSMTGAVVAVPGLNVIAAVLIGLGVCYGLATTDWDSIASRCESYLINQGIIDSDGSMNVFKVPDENGGVAKWFADLALVEMIRAWLFDNEYIKDEVDFPGDFEFSVMGQPFYADNDMTWGNWVDSDYNTGGFTISGDSIMSPSGCLVNTASGSAVKIYDIIENGHTYQYTGSAFVNYNGLFLPYINWASDNIFFIMSSSDGYVLVDLKQYDVVDNYIRPLPGTLFYCYEVVDGKWVKQSYYYSKVAIDTIVYANFTIEYAGNVYYESNLEDTESSGDSGTIVVGSSYDVSLGVLAPSDTAFADGYTTWAEGAISVPGSQVGSEEEEIPYFPIGIGQTYEETRDLAQTDVWAGTSTYEDTTTDTEVITGTFADTAVGTFIGSLIDALMTPFKWLANTLLEGIEAIFVPSEGYVDAKVEALSASYAFAASIVETANMLPVTLSGVTTQPPVIYINLGAQRGFYDMGGEVPFIDLTWYAEYKPTVDALISAFLWLVFIWRVFVALPGIINGTAGPFSLIPMPLTYTTPIGSEMEQLALDSPHSIVIK